MNGPHDLGGQMGFGPIVREPDEPALHADWERRTLALSLAMRAAGAWPIDMERHARERMPPAEYLASSYYAIWLSGMERLIAERGLATPEEIASGRATEPPLPLPRAPDAAAVRASLARGSRRTWLPPASARFTVGDRIRARMMNPTGHTRLPRYVRGRSGRIDGVRGVHPFPDASAAGRGDDPQWLYSVAFDAAEIWGQEARGGDEVLLDLFEPYLDPA